LLLRRYGFPANLSEELAFSIIGVLDFIPVIYSLGNLVYDIMMLDNSFINLPNLMSLIIGVTYVIACGAGIELGARLKIKSQKKIFEKLGSEESESSVEQSSDEKDSINNSKQGSMMRNKNKRRVSYQKARAYFFTDYDRLNPITAVEATENWISYLESLNLEPTFKQILKSTAYMEVTNLQNKDKTQKINRLYDSINNYALYGLNRDVPQQKQEILVQSKDAPNTKVAILRNSLLSNNAFNYLKSLQNMNISMLRSQVPEKLRFHLDKQRYQESQDN
jgi:hypothetical protein